MLKDTPVSERPRERMLRTHASSLSLREILALLLGSGPRGRGCLGLAEDLLTLHGQSPESEAAERALLVTLESGAISSFAGIKGFGVAAHCRLAAAFELGRRYALMRERVRDESRRPLIGSGIQHRLFKSLSAELRAAPYEWLGFSPIYGAGSVGDFCLVASGSHRQVSVDPQELFRRILSLRPAGVVLAHNHPSGSLEASVEDLDLTREVDRLCNALGIPLLGHWIIAGSRQRRINLPRGDP